MLVTSNHWQGWGTLEYLCLRCHTNSWAGEQRCRINGGICILCVYSVEQNAKEFKLYHGFLKKLEEQGQEESTFIAISYWRPRTNMRRKHNLKDMWIIYSTCNLTPFQDIKYPPTPY